MGTKWPSRNRHKITFTDEQQKVVKAMCERLYRFMPPSTALRRIILEVAENIDAFEEMVTQVTNGPQRAPTGPCPDPTPPPADPPDPDQEKIDQDPEKKKKRGSVRGRLLAAKVAETVVEVINGLRPTGRGFEPKTYVDEVARLLAKGYKEPDLIAVVEWKAAECERTGSWEWFKPATLFRVRAFGEKLDEARAGVEHGKGSSRRGQRELYETPDATDAIWMKGVDNA